MKFKILLFVTAIIVFLAQFDAVSAVPVTPFDNWFFGNSQRGHGRRNIESIY